MEINQSTWVQGLFWKLQLKFHVHYKHSETRVHETTTISKTSLYTPHRTTFQGSRTRYLPCDFIVSHFKFHDRGYSDILYEINSNDIMECCTPEPSIITITWLITLFYYPDWVYTKVIKKIKVWIFRNGCRYSEFRASRQSLLE